jgi:hypothetical protein
MNRLKKRMFEQMIRLKKTSHLKNTDTDVHKIFFEPAQKANVGKSGSFFHMHNTYSAV